MSATILEPDFKASFPTAFAPEYKRGLLKRKILLENDPIPLHIHSLKIASEKDQNPEHRFHLRSTMYIDLR